MTGPSRAALIALSLSLTSLGGCGESSEPVSDAAAKGDIQGGTISDDMLPYDTLQSQPPLMGGGEDDDADNDAGNGGSASDAAGSGTDAPTPDEE